MPNETPFQPNPDDQWPLTPRTRYYLWSALGVVMDQLQDDLFQLILHRSVDLADTCSLEVFPPGALGQSVEWWVELLRSGDRLTDAIAVGESMTPRTPAEEAVLYVAISQEIPVLQDMHEEMFGENETFKSLPNTPEDDYNFEAVLGYLTDDGDIAVVFDPARDGIGDPDNSINQYLGMGDYRFAAWHFPFYQEVADGTDT
jgi:hypothetical protein